MIDKDLRILKEFDQEISLLTSLAELLNWDQQTIIPKAAFSERGDQLAYLHKKIHSKKIDPQLLQVLKSLQSRHSKLSFIDKALIKKYQKEVHIARSIPVHHIEQFAKAATASFEAWTTARKQNNFAIFAPHLQKIIKLKQQEAKYINPKLNPYQVHLDLFEEGATLTQMDQLFSYLKRELIPLIQAIKKSQVYKNQKDKLKSLPYTKVGEIQAATQIASLILQSPQRVHLGESIHPFSTQISYNDIRITTATRKTQPLFCFTSASHEAGHALYDLNISSKLKNSILWDGSSLGLHESQSRLWENQITLSKPFWKFYYKTFQKHLPALQTLSVSEFYEQINQVKPGPVRLAADEVTYCLHIIIRYEIERALLTGTLTVKDLPKTWNALYRKYLGTTPKDDLHGVLQDVHWTDGSFGYFPTYALGTIYSAMIYNAVKKQHPQLEREVQKGNFSYLREWLKTNIHRFGATKKAKDIVEIACKKQTTSQDFINYLWEKYGSLYHLKRS